MAGLEDLNAIEQFRLGIGAGMYDKQLDVIIAAVHQRKKLLQQQSAAELLAKITVGSRVRFNDNNTSNFIGQNATVTGIKPNKVIVDLDYPLRGGRGKTWHRGIICDPILLDAAE